MASSSLQGSVDKRVERADHSKVLAGARQGEVEQVDCVCVEKTNKKWQTVWGVDHEDEPQII